MNVRRFTKSCSASVGALLFMSLWPSSNLARAQHGQSSSPTPLHPVMGSQQLLDSAPFVGLVRKATQRFQSVAVAEKEGYVQRFGCVSGGDLGAMGVHYVNDAKVGNPDLDPRDPEVLVYEPTLDGKLQLVAVEYLVLVDSWHQDPRHTEPPQLMGQLFHIFDAPNRFGLPAFYALHVWAWKINPNGTFVNWHPIVTCDFYTGRTGQ